MGNKGNFPSACLFFQWVAGIFILAILSGNGVAQNQKHWVGTWAASQQLVEPQNSLAVDDLRDATLRQIVHLSLGGNEIRVHLSNRFGTAPLKFTSVHVARAAGPGSSAIDAATDKALMFSGAPSVIVPAGADYVSDPIDFTVAPLSDLAISLYLEQPTQQQTGHPGARTTTFAVHGNAVSSAELQDPKKVEHWYFIAGVDVVAPPDATAIVTLGDSITDGHGATENGNDRWPDVLAKRLQAATGMQNIAVLNHGIGGNRLLLDGLGPNALARFDHDVIAQAGARFLVVLEGVNDLGMLTHAGEVAQAEHDELVHRLSAAYEQIIVRAHAHGIKVYGCTVMPYAGSAFYHPDAVNEVDRQAVNTWIRSPGHFDAVIDLDAVMRDPAQPDHLLPLYDSGDHLHPSPRGYAAMANAIPLSLFVSTPAPKIAFTFDDLPEHGPLPPGETRLQVITKIVSALHAADMPPIYGFVNGIWLDKHPDEIVVLQAWHDAGNPLGNHTWSHMNLSQNTLEKWEADTTRNEPLLNSLMKKNEDWHWLRFPFLAEGDTQQKKAGARAFLAQHGYKAAGVTMSFGDYMWNEPYARCMAKNDQGAVEELKSSYLAAAADDARFRRELAQRVFGHDIPYVLLMHVGALDAEMLPQLLEQYRAEGFEFITLQRAESDPFYRNDIDLTLPVSADMLEQVAGERGIPFPPRAAPAVNLDRICR